MDKLLIIVFFILLSYILANMVIVKSKPVVVDEPTHSKPQHILHNILQNFSSGDKVNLTGDCVVNLYTRNTITVDQKLKFTDLIKQILHSVYGLTNHVYEVQELNNIYEQLDSKRNARYIIDATINSTNNFYSVKITVDVVVFNGEILVNSISMNDSSNNNIINRFDMVYQDQGILVEHDTFSENISSILDNQYRLQHNVIDINAKNMDGKNYPLDNVLSLTSLANMYYPAKVTNGTIDNFRLKGMDGLLEQYFPPRLRTVESPQYCDKYRGENCIFQHASTSTEYTQPYMAPGLFFDRSSFPIN